ncbi:pilus assembly FimT family protein [Vibrio quintilis]|uniref:Type II secretion system protein H n=1 Tax=Vibrio quintilis TaxID=1117707 RepID=A0A1M7YYB9_9VIBR|nr:type II secretion system protein [Vibrio quintilis]SHO57584.1 hypothetical protein VQ7734_03354 [Vibrio quintilis]
MNHHRLGKPSGFTLIELIIVIALIALMSAVVVPRLWGSYSQLKQKKKLEAFWSEVRSEALKYNQAGESFLFDSQQEQWQLLAQKTQLEILPNHPDDQFVIRADGFTQHGEVHLLVLPEKIRWKITISMPDGSVHFARY